jgi:hypothetical protein
MFRESLYISKYICHTKVTTNVGDGPHVLVDTYFHVLFAKTRDNLVGGMFLMKFAIASFSSRRM